MNKHIIKIKLKFMKGEKLSIKIGLELYVNVWQFQCLIFIERRAKKNETKKSIFGLANANMFSP